MNKPMDIPGNSLSVDVENYNDSGNASFNEVLDARLSRRHVLRGGVSTAAGAVLAGWGLTACGGGDDEVVTTPTTPAAPVAPSPITTLGFAAVAKSTADVVSVPAGYTAKVIYALGDPLTAATPAFKNDGTDTDYDNRAGDHHDGMEYFGLSSDGTPPRRHQQRPRPAGHEPRGHHRPVPARRTGDRPPAPGQRDRQGNALPRCVHRRSDARPLAALAMCRARPTTAASRR